MTLHQQIVHTLKKHPHDEVLKNMGYKYLKTGEKTLQKFLGAKSIYLWLKTGNFDFYHDSMSFLRALIEALSFSSTRAEETIETSRKRLECIEKMQTPYLYIDTHFKRKSEPLHVLAMMEGYRHIKIDKELLVFKSKKECFNEVAKIIRQHYLAHKGKLKLWGNIYTYVYHHTDGKRYIFLPNGERTNDALSITESKAVLRIGSQKIAGFKQS
jgi:hypothetical protein